MQAAVLLEVLLHSEGLGAVGTLEWSFTSVRAEMVIKVKLPRKCFRALGALERSLAAMCADVTPEIG